MDYEQPPKITIQKNDIPILYLDTNIMILLAQYEKGEYRGEYPKDIADLYEVLSAAIKENRIICPIGNQLEEMGMSAGRERAKKFLYTFTNAELSIPEKICRLQMKAGYASFSKGQGEICFCCSDVLEDIFTSDLFKICVAPVYGKEKVECLCDKKENLTSLLNFAKDASDKECILEKQKVAEFESDYTMLHSILNGTYNSQENLDKLLWLGGEILANTGKLLCDEVVEEYSRFLKSMHHHKLPYVWVRSYLWALRMQRQNKIKRGDVLDTLWVSAYFPYVNYAVTDNDCCALIKEAGLDNRYNTEVFSMKTLKDLVSILLNNSD